MNAIDQLRAEGKGALRRRLERLVNQGIIGVEGARKVYRAAFGDDLKAVKVSRPSLLERLGIGVGR